MLFLNTYEITVLHQEHGQRQDNVGKAVRLLVRVQDDADANSDGWCHWRAPVQASRQLIELLRPFLQPTGWREPRGTLSDAELAKARAPIRAFYTRTRAKVPSYPAFPAELT